MTKIIRYFCNMVIVVVGPNNTRILGLGYQFTCIMDWAYSIMECPRDSSVCCRWSFYVLISPQTLFPLPSIEKVLPLPSLLP